MAQLVGLAQQLEQLRQLVTGMNSGLINLVVLQPTPYCNLDCDYCYLAQRNDRSRMGPETLDAIGRHVLASPLAAQPVSVVWHGGEPMTLPPTWYEEAFTRLANAAPEADIQHAFQTNAVGVNQAWIDLWSRWNLRIGVSLDGPEALHDRHRKTRAGTGSYALTLRGIERLQAQKFPFHIITVLTADSLRDPDRLFDFYLAHDLRDVCFNIEEEEGVHRRSGLNDPALEEAYRHFITRFTERRRRLTRPFRCREIDGVAWLTGASAEQRRYNTQVEPLNILSIAVDGRMSTFSPEFLGVKSAAFNDFAFADVHREGPEAILEHPAFRRLHADILAGIEACRASCAYFDVCGGGAPSNKYFELGSCRGTETLYCRLTRQATLEGVLAAYENDVAMA